MEISDQVIDFYNDLFDCIFSRPFRPLIQERLKRNAVIRQVQESADAASQSLTRFFLNQHLSESQVAEILAGFSTLRDLLKLDDIAKLNETPESMVESLLMKIPCPACVQESGDGAVYRIALHSIVQVLMQVGPVMAEWQKLNFSTTFELPRRVVKKLNTISIQLDTLGKAGQAAADDRYELSYRDYLLQRFYRVEAGTVRMTTNLDVDLRELFVMPKVYVRSVRREEESDGTTSEVSLMDLSQARKLFFSSHEDEVVKGPEDKDEVGIFALEQILKYPGNVLIGAPGSGKSTFLEWLQVKLAAVEEELIMGEGQAIPMLLRVRQLNPQKLPSDGAGLIEIATASKDRAALMPIGWMERQMQEGRVFFMLDGLDETEPTLRDKYLIPWMHGLCEKYPYCRYLISSRPVGYPAGMLRLLKFAECDLLDFKKDQVAEYTRHWCTAVRLARNEPEEEARKEGEQDGTEIIKGFKDHPYIRNLARNPLMLSAICLVNYFEGGKLPEDRALLYKLCVEGLLHNWDQRRGIHSPFRFDEKLRTCREVALAMQSDDSAEFETKNIEEIFNRVLDDPVRAKQMLEHIRYRTGLLIERRAGIFAFAHLTFQEYLAASAIHEGNQVDIDPEQLVRGHADSRWKEVIALYCGLTTTSAARTMIEQLIAQDDTEALFDVLAQAYLAAGQALAQDGDLRQKVMERIAVAPGSRALIDHRSALDHFPEEEVAPLANRLLGAIESDINMSGSYYWLIDHSNKLDLSLLLEKLRAWKDMNPFQLAELIDIVHIFGSDSLLLEMAADKNMYASPGPTLKNGSKYGNQAEIAIFGIARRKKIRPSPGVDTVLLQILRILGKQKAFKGSLRTCIPLSGFLEKYTEKGFPKKVQTWEELALLARTLAEHLPKSERPLFGREKYFEKSISLLNSWADSLEQELVKKAKKTGKRKAKSKTVKKRRRE